MTLTQRQINHGIFGVLTVGGLLLWISALGSAFDSIATLEILIATILTGALWGAYWRGWEHARHIVTVLLTLMVGLGVPDVTRQFDPLIFIPPLIALILTGPQWMLASAIATIGILLVRADGQGVYAHPSNLIEYTVIIIGMAFSGLAVLPLSTVDNSASHSRPFDCPPCPSYPSWALPFVVQPSQEVGDANRLVGSLAATHGGAGLVRLDAVVWPRLPTTHHRCHGHCPAAAQASPARRLPGLPPTGSDRDWQGRAPHARDAVA